MTTSSRKIRIAVLDTGYDPTNMFFRHPSQRDRLAGRWNDFVAVSGPPVDDSGHGSKVLSIIMQLAPDADVYVGRITSSLDSMPDWSERLQAVSSYRNPSPKLMSPLLIKP